MIYQSGYLTIKGYDEEFDIYRLGFPNKEVAEGFIKYLVPYYMPVKSDESVYFVSNFIADVRKGNPEQFMKRLATMFSDTDYKIVGDAELYFQNAFFIVMRMLGFYTKVERPTRESRMDMVIETKDYVYIVEFKLDGTPEEALRQIEEKGYAKPFAMDSRNKRRNPPLRTSLFFGDYTKPHITSVNLIYPHETSRNLSPRHPPAVSLFHRSGRRKYLLPPLRRFYYSFN